jgi:hypothetical protein
MPDDSMKEDTLKSYLTPSAYVLTSSVWTGCARGSRKLPLSGIPVAPADSLASATSAYAHLCLSRTVGGISASCR